MHVRNGALPTDRSRRSPAFGGRLALIGGALALLALVGWLGWTGKMMRDETRAATQRAIRAAELRGTIAYLDEWMTMSARMAAATGEGRWAERFEEAAPKLDSVVAEAASLVDPETLQVLTTTTGEAHRDLVTMERRALSLAASGDLASAKALLDGPEFAYLKDVYATGIEVFGEDLATTSDARSSHVTDQAWLDAAALAAAAVCLVGAAFWVRGRIRLRRVLALAVAAAGTDAVTGLPDRRRFAEALNERLAGGAENALSLLLIDLDRFRAVNDAHGYAAGDEVLTLVATRLRNIVRGQDLLARLGGDEFGLVLGAGPSAGPAPADPTLMAQRVIACLTEPFALASRADVRVGASIGIAMADGKAASDMMSRADVALAKAKSDGRGCFRIFQTGMDDEVRSRARLEGELRQAVLDDAVVPHYQPLIDIRTGALVGVEMLARWSHPVRGMISPAEFIPLAEEIGVIGAMTERLLMRACREAAAWPERITLACNVSPIQLRDPGLPQMIGEILGRTGFPARRLEIEITENALVGDLELARALLDQLKGLGIRLALDDFGTGYSSLRHLRTLPFDKIKIDRSFVTAMDRDAECGKIVSAVLGLSHSLGLSTVAEGIETAEVAELLRVLGCDVGQGWLYGRPGPAAVIDAMLEAAPAVVPSSIAA